MERAKNDERRKVLLVGPIGSGMVEKAREITRECLHWRGREGEQGYAYRAAGLSISSSIFSQLRAPHHTVSRVQMEGRLLGHMWRPGELALAHGGVLFLDLVPEFPRDVLAAVAEAWERKYIHYTSHTVEHVMGATAPAKNHLYVPTYFSLVMGMTACPCGWRGVQHHSCACTERAVERWFDRAKVLTDGAERIDLEYPQRPTLLPVEKSEPAPVRGS